MQVHISKKDAISICKAEGEIDINTAPQFKKAFDALTREKEAKVIINMEKVDYIDSSGLATLVELLKNFRKSGTSLKLTNLAPKVKSLFEITKLEKLFDISEKEEDAVAAF